MLTSPFGFDCGFDKVGWPRSKLISILLSRLNIPQLQPLNIPVKNASPEKKSDSFLMSKHV